MSAKAVWTRISKKISNLIERQTALINNNAQQIDQLQRTLNIQRDDISQVRMDILSSAEHLRQEINAKIQQDIGNLREELKPPSPPPTKRWFSK